MKWLKEHVFDYWHNWASVWVMILLTIAVMRCADSGVVVALVSLAGTFFATTGAVHGWKETAKVRYISNGNAPKVAEDEGAGFKPV